MNDVPISNIDIMLADGRTVRIQKIKMMLLQMPKKEGKPYRKLQAELEKLTERPMAKKKSGFDMKLSDEEVKLIQEAHPEFVWKKD